MKRVFWICLFSVALAWGQWMEWDPMPEPRAGAAACVWGDSIFILGGKNNTGQILNSVDIYDPIHRQWIQDAIPPFHMPRYNAQAIVFQGRIFLIGGISDRGEVTKMVEVYNPVQKKWEFVHHLREKRQGHVATLLNGRICVLGGSENLWYDYTRKMEWYHEGNDNWMEVPGEMPQGVAAPFAATLNNMVYLFGGYFIQPIAQSTKGRVSADWHFSWDSLPDLPTPRAYGGSATIGHRIFLIGGVGTDGYATDVVEVFDTLSQTFSSTFSLNTPRSGMATVVHDSMIYVFGGYNADNSQILSSVEVLDYRVTGLSSPSPAFPDSPKLLQGFPNPFNGQVVLQIQLPSSGPAELSIYNLHGQEIKNIFQGRLQQGTHYFSWDATNEMGVAVPSGIYLAIFKTQGASRAIRLVYVR